VSKFVGPTFYDILNVTPSADAAVVEAAYRALIKRSHPDHAVGGAGDHGQAAEINRAYSTLKHPERRAHYDQWLWAEARAAQRPPVAFAPPVRRPRPAAGWGVGALLGSALLFLLWNPNQAPATATAAVMGAAAGEDAFAADARALAVSLELPAVPSVRSEAPIFDIPAEAGGPPSVVESEQPRPVPRTSVKSRPRPADPSADQMFLEREGYIY
jgi:hypothetical protein